MVEHRAWSTTTGAGGEGTQGQADAYDVGEAGNTAGTLAPGAVHGGSDGHFDGVVDSKMLSLPCEMDDVCSWLK